MGNTVIVVEHDEDAIRAADHVVDMGPGAGEHGGAVIAGRPPTDIVASPDSLPAPFSRAGGKSRFRETDRAGWRTPVRIRGAAGNNLVGR